MQYFIYTDNKQHGPYTPEELTKHGLSSETLVWAEGMDGWTPAWQIKELRDILDGKTRKEYPPAARTEATSNEGGQEDNAPKVVTAQDWEEDGTITIKEEAYKPWRGKHTAQKMAAFIVGVLLAILLTATCPGKSEHVEALGGILTENIIKQRGLSEFLNPLLEDITAYFIASETENLFKVDNYFIFSTGSVQIDGKWTTVSFGILGHVFMFNPDYIQQSESNG